MILAVATAAPIYQLTTDAARWRFPTQEACLSDAKTRADALAGVGMHGDYLCLTMDMIRSGDIPKMGVRF